MIVIKLIKLRVRVGYQIASVRKSVEILIKLWRRERMWLTMKVVGKSCSVAGNKLCKVLE